MSPLKDLAGSDLSRATRAAAVGYGLGWFPSASISIRLAGAGNDLIRSGTRNPGTYNVYGHLGGRWAAAVGLADTGKGAGAACAALVGAAAFWSWRRLPNPGGPRPGPGLAAYALITSGALASRWLPAKSSPTQIGYAP